MKMGMKKILIMIIKMLVMKIKMKMNLIEDEGQ